MAEAMQHSTQDLSPGCREVIDYLQNGFDIPLRDPLWKHVYLNQAFQKLIHAEPFLRLSNIRQLSSATLVYPGSRHTRFEHSIGVFRMARLLLIALLRSRNSRAAEFEPTLHGAKAFLAGALLHDLGHFPYAHVLEGLQTEHEEISARYILNPPLADIITQDLQSDPALVAALVDETLPIPPEYQTEGLFYRSLLSGTLDPDKLDYLNRDAYYCGVPYGIQDLEYLFSQVHLCRLDQPEQAADGRTQEHSPFRICIPENGLTIIENLIFSRYLMYRTVYWHRNVRALSVPVLEATARALELGLLGEEQLFVSDDRSFPALFSELELPEKELCLQAQMPRKFVVADELCLGEADPEFLARLRDYSQRRKLCRDLYDNLQRRYPATLQSLQSWQVMLDLTGPKKMQIQDIYVSRPLSLQARTTRQYAPIPFMQSSTVLQPNTLEDFRKSLTMLRLVLPLKYREGIPKQDTPLSDFIALNENSNGNGGKSTP
ncbi:HD domain-containing protein [Candidatus Haliotispira prima]|uniref:HD domain-containing protein n=1 Tax=Candidatus Haliotispira prima TaxID=3034016 RepID=A0ABY8MDR0_9SPIO|nr:HD domain-containing protein [Candidatus Haliotispira prima]